MRFRPKNKNKKKKISVIQKIKGMNYIRKELKNIKTKANAQQRIAVFYDEYNNAQPIIEQKLNEAKKLNHTENYNHILAFKNDLDSLKKLLDKIVHDINDEKLDKSIKARIMNTRTGTLALAFRLMGTMSGKYKKENCDIDEFEV